jgi:hypothetical protein
MKPKVQEFRRAPRRGSLWEQSHSLSAAPIPMAETENKS